MHRHETDAAPGYVGITLENTACLAFIHLIYAKNQLSEDEGKDHLITIPQGIGKVL
jgi:hypothetical protein